MIGIYPRYDAEKKFIGWEVWFDGRRLLGPCDIAEAAGFVERFMFLGFKGLQQRTNVDDPSADDAKVLWQISFEDGRSWSDTLDAATELGFVESSPGKAFSI